MEGGKPTVIANAEGLRTTPSVVAYSKTGERLVGQLGQNVEAVGQSHKTPFTRSKDLSGRRFDPKCKASVTSSPTRSKKLLMAAAKLSFKTKITHLRKSQL